jgi:hypothetical protein
MLDAKTLASTITANTKVAGKEQWYPTQAKTGLEWGTQRSWSGHMF